MWWPEGPEIVVILEDGNGEKMMRDGMVEAGQFGKPIIHHPSSIIYY